MRVKVGELRKILREEFNPQPELPIADDERLEEA
jgi:hypothetical protein